MNQEELRDFAARYTEAWCSHDANATAAFFAEDGSIAVNGRKPAVGRTEIAQLVQVNPSEFNALAEKIIGPYKTELIYRQGTSSSPLSPT